MYLKYGNYPHDSGECKFAISRDGTFTDGIPQGYTERNRRRGMRRTWGRFCPDR